MKNDRSLGRRIFLFNVDIEWVVEVGIQGYHPFFFFDNLKSVRIFFNYFFRFWPTFTNLFLLNNFNKLHLYCQNFNSQKSVQIHCNVHP